MDTMDTVNNTMNNTMNTRVAFITGGTGQDGSYLTELLLSKGYTVHLMIRKASQFNTQRIEHLYKDKHEQDNRLTLHYGDMTDSSCINTLIDKIQPDYVYNLAAQSHVKVSEELPEYTSDVNALGTLRLLSACVRMKKQFKFYQASTSEMFGGKQTSKQNEETELDPRSVYAISKVFAHNLVNYYRKSLGVHATCGILFNHTSPRRGDTFVEKKIVKAAVAIVHGKQKCLYLGNLYSKRDFTHAKDCVYAMWLMLEQPQPDDYVIASGISVTIKELVNYVFKKLGRPITWSGEGVNEVGSFEDGRPVVKVDKGYFRMLEVDFLEGDASKARKILGWKPQYTWCEIMDEMIQVENSRYNECVLDDYRISRV